MEISHLFEKKMISFKFNYNESNGLSFELEDASSYFEGSINPKAKKPVCFNGASYSTDLIYDTKHLLNTHNIYERTSAHGFCSFENIETCKNQFASEVTALVHKRIKELECIKNKHIDQLENMPALELTNLEICEKLANIEDLDFSVESYGVFVSEFIPNYNNSESTQYDPICDKKLWDELITKYGVVISNTNHTISIDRNGTHERSFVNDLSLARNALMVIIDSEINKS